MRLKLHRLPRSSSNQYPSLELFLNQKSSYTLQINSSFLDILSQLIRYYIFLLPTFLFTVLCISYSLQINDIFLRTYQTMLAWQVHIPIAILITILYKIIILIFPSSNFVVNIHSNGYYFFFLPLIMYFLALSLWGIISLIIDYFIFDSIRFILQPTFIGVLNALHIQPTVAQLIQWFLLSIPLLATIACSGSNGHITLFLLALSHIIWRGTINRRLKEVLTTLLLFHGLLVFLNLTGFIIYIKTLFVQGLLPLYLIMSDPSFLSALCCIAAFYFRFIFNRTQSKLIRKIKSILLKNNRVILTVVAISCQFLCSYSMYYLWMFIFFIFIHSAVIFFVPTYPE